jgi:hypothetical protein
VQRVTVASATPQSQVAEQGDVIAIATYFIVPHAGRWRIAFNQQVYGLVYASADLALRQAICWAQAQGERGHEAQVMVQDDESRWQVKWTYGTDPFPSVE